MNFLLDEIILGGEKESVSGTSKERFFEKRKVDETDFCISSFKEAVALLVNEASQNIVDGDGRVKIDASSVNNSVNLEPKQLAICFAGIPLETAQKVAKSEQREDILQRIEENDISSETFQMIEQMYKDTAAKSRDEADRIAYIRDPFQYVVSRNFLENGFDSLIELWPCVVIMEHLKSLNKE